MREADVAIRLRQPTQPDLIQRKLFSVHFHAYASPEYLKRFGTPRTHDELDKHHLLVLGGNVPSFLQNTRWLVDVARNGKGPRTPHLVINNIIGILRACQAGLGIAMLPDYIVEEDGGLVQLFGEEETIALDAYFVYPEELKSVARVQASATSSSARRSAGTIEPARIRHACGMATCGSPGAAACRHGHRCWSAAGRSVEFVTRRRCSL
jgi:DNA-binding transcriptional LysR family regulator